MKKTFLVVVLLAAGCSAQPDNTKLYEAGWAQAREDACNCDPFVSEPRLEEQARKSSAWENGYYQGCRWMNGRPACRAEKPSLAEAQKLEKVLWTDRRGAYPAKVEP